MKDAVLSPRLLSAANFVRQGAVFADVGTDHAYLPLFLLGENKIVRAICSDINEGPLASARRNAEEQGMLDPCEFILTDGAAALEGKGITDMAICGMGGELIADIIAAAPYLKADGVNLILQPMTRHAHLRRFLASAGFSVIGEKYSSEPRHNYVTLLARYTGGVSEISALEAEIGKPPYALGSDPARRLFIADRLAALKRAAAGKAAGNTDASYECRLISEIEEIMSL